MIRFVHVKWAEIIFIIVNNKMATWNELNTIYGLNDLSFFIKAINYKNSMKDEQ